MTAEKNRRKLSLLNALYKLLCCTNAQTKIHTLLTFQEDTSDDIWSDRVSLLSTCGDGVKYRAVAACLNSL